jgi:hypothetical protein
MYGAIRSNDFRVRNPAEFRRWFEENVTFGQGVELWSDVPRIGASDVFCFGADAQYPMAHPQHPVEDSDSDQEPWDLDEFAEALRLHLVEGEYLHVVAGGAEKLRYVGFTELLITADVVQWRVAYSDDEATSLLHIEHGGTENV